MTNDELQDLRNLLNQSLSPIAERLDRIDQSLPAMSERLGKVEEALPAMTRRMDKMDDSLTRVHLTLENIVNPALDALVEGQDLLHQRMKELAGRDEVQELRDELRLLRKVVAQHTKEIDELKKAQ